MSEADNLNAAPQGLKDFEYTPLTTSPSFRLFSFDDQHENGPVISLKLEVLSFSPESRPSYDAISYVCGDPHDKVASRYIGPCSTPCATSAKFYGPRWSGLTPYAYIRRTLKKRPGKSAL